MKRSGVNADPHQPLPAAPARARSVRRAGLLGRAGERPGDPRLRRRRLAGQPERRPGVGGGVSRPHRAHRRARQEPRVRGHVVAGQRGRHGPQPRRHRALGAPPRPGAARALRGRPHARLHRRLLPDVPLACRGRGDLRRLRTMSPACRAVPRRSGCARRPFVMCEYAHAMGNGPGALDTYDAQADASPRHHGGFVWEWRDHGLLTRTADGTPYFAYGGDFGEVVHDGNFVMDGMVLPDDTPTPGLAEFAAVNAPVQSSPHGDDRSRSPAGTTPSTPAICGSSRSSRTTGARSREELELRRSPPAPAGGPAEPSRSHDLDAARTDAEDNWLTVRAELAAGRAWAARGHVVAHAQFARRHARADRAHAAAAGAPARKAGDAEFDERTGRLRQLFGLDIDGPRLELWRAPTDNDRGIAFDSHGRPLVGEPLARARPGPVGAPRSCGDPGGRRARGPHAGRRRGQRAVRRRHLSLGPHGRDRAAGRARAVARTGTAPGPASASASTCLRRCARRAGSAPARTSRTRTRRVRRGSGGSPPTSTS